MKGLLTAPPDGRETVSNAPLSGERNRQQLAPLNGDRPVSAGPAINLLHATRWVAEIIAEENGVGDQTL